MSNNNINKSVEVLNRVASGVPSVCAPEVPLYFMQHHAVVGVMQQSSFHMVTQITFLKPCD